MNFYAALALITLQFCVLRAADRHAIYADLNDDSLADAIISDSPIISGTSRSEWHIYLATSEGSFSYLTSIQIDPKAVQVVRREGRETEIFVYHSTSETNGILTCYVVTDDRLKALYSRPLSRADHHIKEHHRYHALFSSLETVPIHVPLSNEEWEAFQRKLK